MRGRKIYGELVPYDEVWCPGANWATTITSLEGGLEIGTMKLPKGTYAIWVSAHRKGLASHSQQRRQSVPSGLPREQGYWSRKDECEAA